MNYFSLLSLFPFLVLQILITNSSAQQCGKQVGGALCPDNLCCSKYGWCGSTSDYCGDGCQSQCKPPPPDAECGKEAGGALCPNNQCCSESGWCGTTEVYCGFGCQSQCPVLPSKECGRAVGGTLCPDGQCCSEYGSCGLTNEHCGIGCQSQCGGDDVESVISRSTFDEMFKRRDYISCNGKNLFTYDAFITAAKTFPAFGTTGDLATRKKEIAAFLGQTSHETTGGWEGAPGGPYEWGYCFVREVHPIGTYCGDQTIYPCAPGRTYIGRGPIQLSWNYNYGQCGEGLELDLLNNPDVVATNPVISFESSIWFWMTQQSPKPSCHDVIIGKWVPSAADVAAGRLPGYGTITNIINGGIECGQGPNPQNKGRIGFYNRYCGMFGIQTGDNLDCYNQRPFGWGFLVDNSSLGNLTTTI